MPTATLHQAEAQLAELIDAALRGEEVIIARDGVPAVKLVPMAAAPKRRGGFWEGKIKILDPDWDKPDPELERLFYEGDVLAEGGFAPAPNDRASGPAPKRDDDAPAG